MIYKIEHTKVNEKEIKIDSEMRDGDFSNHYKILDFKANHGSRDNLTVGEGESRK